MNKYQELVEYVDAYLDTGLSRKNSEMNGLLQKLVSWRTPLETGIVHSQINPAWTAEICGACDYLISNDDVYCAMCGQKIGRREK